MQHVHKSRHPQNYVNKATQIGPLKRRLASEFLKWTQQVQHIDVDQRTAGGHNLTSKNSYDHREGMQAAQGRNARSLEAPAGRPAACFCSRLRVLCHSWRVTSRRRPLRAHRARLPPAPGRLGWARPRLGCQPTLERRHRCGLRSLHS